MGNKNNCMVCQNASVEYLDVRVRTDRMTTLDVNTSGIETEFHSVREIVDAYESGNVPLGDLSAEQPNEMEDGEVHMI